MSFFSLFYFKKFQNCWKKSWPSESCSCSLFYKHSIISPVPSSREEVQTESLSNGVNGILNRRVDGSSHRRAERSLRLKGFEWSLPIDELKRVCLKMIWRNILWRSWKKSPYRLTVSTFSIDELKGASPIRWAKMSRPIAELHWVSLTMN